MLVLGETFRFACLVERGILWELDQTVSISKVSPKDFCAYGLQTRPLRRRLLVHLVSMELRGTVLEEVDDLRQERENNDAEVCQKS